MTVCEDFATQFDDETLATTLAAAGRHSLNGVPEDTDDRLLFALLEMLDYECCKYGDAPATLTTEGIQSFLLRHKERVGKLPEPPSYLGLCCGVCDFLAPNEAKSGDAK